MSKKMFKTFGTTFAAIAFALLFFPWIYAYCEGELVSADMTTTGFGLACISAWGTVTFIIPLLILGVAFSKLSEKTKTVFLLGLYLLGSVSFYYATSIGMEWLREISTEYVRAEVSLFLYPLAMFLSLISFYLSYNTTNRSSLNLIGIEEGEDEVNNDIGEFYLCCHPYTFGKFKKGEDLTEFPGYISFITEDGYFAALGHSENYSYLEDGCIEIFDGENAVGFVSQMRVSCVYGSFYDDHKIHKSNKIRIAPFNAIENGKAELWISGENGFIKKTVEITANSPVYITCKLSEGENADKDIDGAVIVQKGKAVAVVSGYDEENDVFSCTSASRVAIPLIHIAYEQRQLEQEMFN